MNELVFVIHVLILMGFSLVSLRFGEKALSAFIVLMGVSSNLFVLKQITLFNLDVTAADAYAICALFSLNLLQEYFGKEKAKEVVKINFYLMVVFGVLAFMHLSYIPAQIDQTQLSYKAILSSTPRIILASIFSYFLSQRIDLFVFSYLRSTYFKNSLSVAAIFSSSFSQIFDTILFSFLALYGSVSSIGSIIFLSLVIKFITICWMAPMMNLSKKIMVKSC
jgi:uncharacterized integral membrane protein (TIGR00697 family)